MQFLNNKAKYGFITKLIHWSIFFLFITQYFLVYRREYFAKDAPEKLQYILLHKSIGVVVLGLALGMIIWRHLNKKPLPPVSMTKPHICLARAVHLLLYLSMLIMPISGIAMSQLSGYKVSVFNWFEVPTMLAKNKPLSGIFYDLHVYSSYVIIGLVSAHILAALFHHFISKDNVLKRMTWGL